jgi:hypothetical protein
MLATKEKVNFLLCADGPLLQRPTCPATVGFEHLCNQIVMKNFLINFCLSRSQSGFLYSVVNEGTGEHTSRNAEAKLRKLLQ